MGIQAILAFSLVFSTSVMGQSLTMEVDPAMKFEDALKGAVVKLVKDNPSLATSYVEMMDKAFDFLDPEDPRRINASDIANLGDYSLSQWIPSHSFRYGQGDYSYCDIDSELASFDMGTALVGFDTSYKREETYGFWAVYSYTYDSCEDDQGVINKARLRLEHVKWMDSEAVSQLLY